MNQEDHYLKCPSCGAQSNVDPALLAKDAPMPYCKECDEPLITEAFIERQPKEETQDELWIEVDKIIHETPILDPFKRIEIQV